MSPPGVSGSLASGTGSTEPRRKEVGAVKSSLTHPSDVIPPRLRVVSHPEEIHKAEGIPKRRIAIFVVIALLLGLGIGYGVRAMTADPVASRACLQVVNTADRGLAMASTHLAHVADGLDLIVVGGELPEAYDELADVRTRMSELQTMRADLATAKAACEAAA